MATLAEFGIDLDLDSAKREISGFAKKSEKEFEDVVSSAKGIQTAVDGINLPTNEVEKLGAAYDKTAKSANKSLNAQKKALAELVKSGKEGSKEYEDLLRQTKENIAAQKEFDDALKKVSRDLDGIGDKDIEVDFDVKGTDKLEKAKSAILGFGAAAAAGGILAVGAGLKFAADTAREVE